MEGNKTLNKKTIIAIVTIIVLLFIAGLSVGIFLADKGKTEAADGNEISNNIAENTTTDDNNVVLPSEENNNNNDGNTNNDNNGNTEIGNNDNGNETPNQQPNNNPTITTGTNVDEVGETTITRYEEQERLVSKDYWDWWKPTEVDITATGSNLNVKEPKLKVVKEAITEAGNKLVYANQEITYVITVENTGDEDVKNIEITDKIPAKTTFVSVDNEGTPIIKDDIVIGVKWIASVNAGEKVKVQFTVKVNEDETGTITNAAIANGEESNEELTAVITNNKSSEITRNGKNVETAKAGDTIKYTITVKNTGKIDGETIIEDNVPTGTKLISAEGANISLVDGKTTLTWTKVIVPAEGEIQKEFTVEVVDIESLENEKITNVATVGGKDTDPTKDPTADIKIEKTVTDIKRIVDKEVISIGTDSKVLAGDVIEYTIKVTNTGSEDLTNVNVKEKLEGIKITSGDFNIGDLKAGESKEIKVTYTVDYDKDINGNDARLIHNEVVVKGETTPKDPDKKEEVTDEDEKNVEVDEVKSLTIVKEATKVNEKDILPTTKVRPTDQIDYTITVTNNGNVTLNNIKITDSLKVIFENSVKEPGEIVYTIPSLEAGKDYTITVTYVVTENDCATLTSILNVATATVDEIKEKDDDDTVPVNPDTEVTVTKTWDDNDNQDGVRPSTITVKLYADGVFVKEETIKANAEGNTWTYTFTKLPKYKNGTEIVYTVEEVPVENYEQPTYSDDTLTIINKHIPETTEVTVNKTWNDNDDQDGVRPNSINVSLLADGKEVAKATITADENWTHTFTDLPKYRDHRTEIKYTVEEVTVDKYTTSINGTTITNTHTPEKTEVTVTKTWDDNNNQDGIRPKEIKVRLLANGTKVAEETIKPDENGDWTHTFTDLPKYRDHGTEIVYTVEEVPVDKYTTSITGTTITNTHIPETTEVTVTKTWDDKDNQDGIRPTEITVRLLADGLVEKVVKVKADANGNWSYTFKNLPKYKSGKEIEYTVDEYQVKEGYTSSVSETTITNTHIPATTEVTVTKTWEDNNNQDGIRPSTITVKLYADGVYVKDATIEANAEGNTWTYTFTNLPKYKNGTEIVYTVVEDEVDGYDTSVTGTTITNTHEPETTEVTVTKTWDDNNNQDGIRPKEITVKLYADGKYLKDQTITPNAEVNTWTYTFTDLDKKANGKDIIYTVVEDQVTGYEQTTYSSDTLTITNKHKPATTEVTVNKTWDDNTDQDGIRPSTITVKLYADGKYLKDQKITPDANGKWTYTFTGLDKKANGIDIKYTVVEEKVDGYEQPVYSEDNGIITITNTHTPATTEITVTKDWADNNNEYSIRPEEIKVQLYADGNKQGEEVSLNEGNNWSYTFKDLAQKANGENIEYTVRETTNLTGYTSTISSSENGYVITNTLNEIEDEDLVLNKNVVEEQEDGSFKVIEESQLKDKIYNVGDTVWYSITVTNNGSKTASRTVTDEIPTGIEFVSVSDSIATPTYNATTKTVTWKVTNLPSGESRTIYIKGTVTKDAIKGDPSEDITIGVDWWNTDNTITSSDRLIKLFIRLDGNIIANDQHQGQSVNEYTTCVGTMLATKVLTSDELVGTQTIPTTLEEYAKLNSDILAKVEKGVNLETIAQNINALNQKVWNENTQTYETLTFDPETQMIVCYVLKSEADAYHIDAVIRPREEKQINLYEVENIAVSKEITSNVTINVGETIELVNVPVRKIWKDNNIAERPDVTVQLYKNGTAEGNSIILNDANNWEYKWTKLHKYDSQGNEIQYTVKEIKIGNETVKDNQTTNYIVSQSVNEKTGVVEIVNTYKNVTINKQKLTSTSTESGTVAKNVDVVFILDTSSSMQGSSATNMVNALNNAMGEILKNSNNRVGIVGYSDKYYGDELSTEILGLQHYTAKSDDQYIKIRGAGDNTLIYPNVNESNGNSRRVRGATYTQIGIRDAANMLINADSKEGRTPVIILLTDGDPTRYTTSYNNVEDYTNGNGKNRTNEGAYYTIRSAKCYKQLVNDAYDKNAQFYTIGIGMKSTDAYQTTLLNPTETNVTNARKNAYGLYNLLSREYDGTGEFTDNLGYYSYADGSYIGEMDENALNQILQDITSNITKNYTTVKTSKTSNIDVDVARVELENLDPEEKITISLDGVSKEYTISELGDAIVTENGIYYIDLKNTLFENISVIDITYHEIAE